MFSLLANSLRRRSALLAPLLLAAILLAPFASILLRPGGRVLGQVSCDNPSMFYFLNDFAGQARRDGKIPHWNPDIMLGLPFVGEGQAAVFHPLSSLFAWLPTGVAINWLCALCLLAAGLSFYGYLRALDLRRDAALCAAVVWGLSSVHTSRIYAGHLSILLGLFCWPLMLMGWERFRRGGGVLNLAGLSLTYACLILAAHPQTLYIFSLFMLMYVLVQTGLDLVGAGGLPAAMTLGGTGVPSAVKTLGGTSFRPAAVGGTGVPPVPYGRDGRPTHTRSRRQLLACARRIGWLGAFVLLGVGVGAVQLLPSFDFARNSFRASSTYEFCTTFSFPPENFLTLLCPRFFGSGSAGSPDPYWGRNYPWEMWLYVGILPLAAAVTGLLRGPWRMRVTLAACGIAFLLIGLGKHTPLFRVLYEVVPFFDTFRSPSKHLQVSPLCMTTLAAYGFQYWFGGFGRDDQTSAGASATRPQLPHRSAEGGRRKGGRGDAALAADAGAPAEAAGRWAFAATLLFACAVLAIVVWMYAHYVSGATSANSAYSRFMTWRYAQGETYLPAQSARDAARVAALAAESGRQLAWAMAFSLLTVAAIPLLRWTAARRLGVAIVLPVVLLDLGVFTAGQLPTFEESRTRYDDDILAALRGGPAPTRIHDPTTYPNKAMSYGLSSLGGYSGNTLPRYNAYINRTQGYRPGASQAQARIKSLPPSYRMLAIDRLIMMENEAPRGAAVRARAAGRAVLDFPGAHPRAFLAESPRAVDNAEAALDYVARDQSDTLRSPCVEGAVALPQAAALDSTERVALERFGRNRVELSVHAARPRLLVLNEMYYKDWTASVNGAATDVLPANYLFRGVLVPAGDSTVVFEFRSAAFTWGARVTVLSLILLVVAGVSPEVIQRRRRSADRCGA